MKGYLSVREISYKWNVSERWVSKLAQDGRIPGVERFGRSWAMLEKRMEVRPRHLEGMKALGKRIVVAGGLLDDEGKMKGSALVMEFENRAALDEYLKNESYVVEGVWKKVEVEMMNVVLVNGEKRA